MFSTTPGLDVTEIRSSETPKYSWMLQPWIILPFKTTRRSDQKSEGLLHFQSLWKVVGVPKQREEEKGHNNIKWRLAELQPGEEGCGENKQLGFLCQNECSSLPNPFAATWPRLIPCADPSTHLRTPKNDARQKHGVRKGEGLGGTTITLEETCPEWWHQRSRPAGTQRFPSRK